MFAPSLILLPICCIGSGAVALAHFDGNGIDEAVCTMVARVQELALGYPEGRIELQLIGGYRDPQGYGEEVFYSIMRKYTVYVIKKAFLNIHIYIFIYKIFYIICNRKWTFMSLDGHSF